MKKSPVESPMIRSFRELLGVTNQASAEEIKKAYRRMVLLYHPDRNPDPASRDQFLKVTEAFETLNDPKNVDKMNQNFIRKKLFDYPIEGLNLSFGSFFGYRTFSVKRVEKKFRLGREKAGEEDADVAYYDLSASDTSESILDNPAYDSIELVYAGKLSMEDEEKIMGDFKGRQLGQLPWILLNNRGIIYFLEGKFSEALKCYQELNDRIPNNIIFLYRLGLCYAIQAFKNPKAGFLGRKRADPAILKKSVDSLRRAIAVGENRTVGKQKCLTIRKHLADILEKAGESRLAKKVWEEVRLIDPDSVEAAVKLGRRPPLLVKKARG